MIRKPSVYIIGLVDGPRFAVGEDKLEAAIGSEYTRHEEPMKIEVSPVMEKPADTVAKANAEAVAQTVTSDTLRCDGSADYGAYW